MSASTEQSTPSLVKTIVCLANSRKLSGRCIAGREVVNDRPGGWIRPVSNREHQEVSEEERRFDDGTDPKVLDIIKVPLIGHRPDGYQQENWELDPNHYWRRTGRLSWDALQAFVEPDGPLWRLDQRHSYHGLNDRVTLEKASGISSSLRLIRVKSLEVSVRSPGQEFGNPKRRLQGRFRYAGALYHLWVTDPVYERLFLGQPDATHELGECCLTISLGEPYDGYAYKLIAAIIEPEGNAQ